MRQQDKALELYFVQIKKYAILTEKEERELALRYRETGDPAALEEMVCSNLRFVVTVAKKYTRHNVHLLDLIQEGNLGLYRAAEKFDPDRGVRFLSYAGWWVRQRILNYLTDNLTEIKIGTTNEKRKAMVTIKKALHRTHMTHPGLSDHERIEVAAGLVGVSVEVAHEVLFRMQGETHLDEMIGEEISVADVIPDTGPSPEELVDAGQTPEYYQRAFELAFQWVLTQREERVIRLRYLRYESLTLDEVGKLPEFDFTRERTRQIEARAMRKLRIFFSTQGIDIEFDDKKPITLIKGEVIIGRNKIIQLLRDENPVVQKVYEQMGEFQQRVLRVRHLNGRHLSQRNTAIFLKVSLAQIVRSEDQAFVELDQAILKHLTP